MRQAYLGLFEIGALAGSSAMRRQIIDLLREITIKHDLPAPVQALPASKMIYIAAYQGGIEKILEMPNNHCLGHEPDSSLLLRRGQPIEPCIEALNFAMEVASRGGSRDENASKEADRIMLFVHDLIVAMANNVAVVNVSGIPTRTSVLKSLPADVAMPICSLLSCLTTTSELLPAPRLSLDKDAISRLDKLLLSGAFNHYVAAHEVIGSLERPSSLSHVAALGNKLMDAGRNLLCKRRASLTLLPIIPKLVDAALGKLPGLLAQAAGDFAMQYASQRRSIVIYKFEDCINEYRKTSFLGMLGSLPPDVRDEFAQALFDYRASRRANIKMPRAGDEI
jgi:hypothetical protein